MLNTQVPVGARLGVGGSRWGCMEVGICPKHVSNSKAPRARLLSGLKLLWWVLSGPGGLSLLCSPILVTVSIFWVQIHWAPRHLIQNLPHSAAVIGLPTTELLSSLADTQDDFNCYHWALCMYALRVSVSIIFNILWTFTSIITLDFLIWVLLIQNFWSQKCFRIGFFFSFCKSCI